MEIYNILSAICLAFLLALVLVLVVSFIKKNRDERITFIRQFKKGKCAIIYLISIPLYVIGLMYTGQDFIKAFFNAINKSMVLVVLRFDISSIDALMKVNSLYTFTVYFSFVLVTINAMLFTISFLQQSIWNFFSKLHWFLSKKEKLLIIGSGKENINIYKSEKERISILLNDFSNKETETLYRKNIKYIDESNINNTCDKIIDLCSKNKNSRYLIVINTLDDEKNIKLCNNFIKKYESIVFDKSSPYSKEDVIDLFSRLRIYVFGSLAQESIYLDVANSSYGCINYINKYSKIASSFINEHPFTKYMNENHIDYSSALVKKDCSINTVMLGFGNTNKQIFLTSVANNQFVSLDENNNVVLKPINYHIFDKTNLENDKNLNFNYYRFKNEFNKSEEDKYLPLPQIPANEHFYKMDVNDKMFYSTLSSCLSKSEKDINFAIISFGTDLENIDLASKLLTKKDEWQIKNLIVFVKVRSGMKHSSIFNRKDCFIIGDENKEVYNIQKIDEDEIINLAKKRNEIYALEYESTSNPTHKFSEEEINNIFLNALYNWHTKLSQSERESNIYACLSLRFKLNLINLDFKKDAALTSISEEEFLKIYSENDPIEYLDVSAQNKKIVTYPEIFKESKRKNLAIQEHYRWNSFMISKGTIPASINEILTEKTIVNNKEKFTNGKSYLTRKHGNLTTFDGLLKFRELVAKRDNTSIKEKDVIKYDYQLLDDAYWLLTNSSYIIIKKDNNV